MLVAALGAGCKTESAPEAKQRPTCASGTYYDIRFDRCATPRTAEDRTVQGSFLLYEELEREQPNLATRNQVSFVRWLSEEDLDALVADSSVVGIEHVTLHFPDLGMTVPVALPEGTSKTGAVEVAFEQAYKVFGTFVPSSDPSGRSLREILPDIRKAGRFDIGSALLRTASVSDGLAFWEKQKSIIRVSTPMGSSQQTMPMTILPDEAER